MNIYIIPFLYCKLFKLIYLYTNILSSLVLKIKVQLKYLVPFNKSWSNLNNKHVFNSTLLEKKKLSKRNIIIGSGTKPGCRSIQFGPRLNCIQRTRVQIRVESKVHYQFYRGTFCIPETSQVLRIPKHTENAPVSPLWWRKLKLG